MRSWSTNSTQWRQWSGRNGRVRWTESRQLRQVCIQEESMVSDPTFGAATAKDDLPVPVILLLVEGRQKDSCFCL